MLDRNPSTAVLRVLRLLLDGGAEMYGQEIHQRTGLKRGTVYSLLYRLEGEGVLRSRVDAGQPPAGGPRRRRYTLTDAGTRRTRELIAVTLGANGAAAPSPEPADV